MDGLADPFGVVLVAVRNDVARGSLDLVAQRGDAYVTHHYYTEGA